MVGKEKDMHEKQENTEKSTQITPSQDEQVLIEHLSQQWQKAHEPSPEELQSILELAADLPDHSKSAALTAIGEHLTSHLILHFLGLIATFRQKAEQEGISLIEREACIQDVLNERLDKIIDINHDLVIVSLEDLSTLSAITLNLQTLSHAHTAEDAQTWMYELPTMYRDELSAENLLSTIEYLIHEPDIATTQKHAFQQFSRKAV